MCTAVCQCLLQYTSSIAWLVQAVHNQARVLSFAGMLGVAPPECRVLQALPAIPAVKCSSDIKRTQFQGATCHVLAVLPRVLAAG